MAMSVWLTGHDTWTLVSYVNLLKKKKGEKIKMAMKRRDNGEGEK
jgi:hypothetical protein